jgi:hypothetical protein
MPVPTPAVQPGRGRKPASRVDSERRASQFGSKMTSQATLRTHDAAAFAAAAAVPAVAALYGAHYYRTGTGPI